MANPTTAADTTRSRPASPGPLPRWCYFLCAITATALVAVMAGVVTVAAAVVF
jgi:hypothetical protein